MNLHELRRFGCAAFDFDGTLADSNGAFIDFCGDCFREVGREMPAAFIERAKAMSLTDFCADLGRELGVWSREQVVSRLDTFTGDFYSRRVTLKPGARRYLTLLRDSGVKLCILSATSERYIRMAVERLGLEEFFSFIVTPDQVGGLSKSQPEIFRLACRLFDAAPEDVVLYDDALEALRTAQSVGMVTVGVYDDANRETMEEIRGLCHGYTMDFDTLCTAWTADGKE